MHRYMQCMRAYAEYASEQDIEGTNTGIEYTRGFWNGQLANAVQPSYLLGHSLLRESH